MNTLNDTDTPEIAAKQIETDRVATLFDSAGEALLDFQDSPLFANYLDRNDIPFDDTLPQYWEAVDTLSSRYLKNDSLGFDDEQKSLFRLVAGAPNALYKEFILHDEEERFRRTGQHSFPKSDADAYVTVVSNANTRIRDFIGEHPNIDQRAFTALVSEAANRGIDEQYWNEANGFTDAVIHGVRTELGFEQKLTAAGLEYRRGTTEEDRRGVDYIVEGVPIDVKSSLRHLQEHAPAGHDKAYYVSRGVAKYFPYDRDTDYEDGTFILKKGAAATHAPQIAADIRTLQKQL